MTCRSGLGKSHRQGIGFVGLADILRDEAAEKAGLGARMVGRRRTWHRVIRKAAT